MDLTSAPDVVVDHFRADRRSLRVAFVTETYPPEVNGVALTTARFVEGLLQRHHEVQLVRLRQGRIEPAGSDGRLHELLMRGLPIPHYPDLRMGVPCKRLLVKTWSRQRPDVVHIATEGPLGWSALQAALHLDIPTTSDFRTNFHAYSRHYGMGWLRKPIMAYLRKFHNRTRCTMVPTEALRQELAHSGFHRLAVVSRGVDTALFDPGRRSEALRRQWGVGPQEFVVMHVGRLAAEKNLHLLMSAFEALRDALPQARLVLVGEGPLKAELQARCPGALFAGQRTGEDLATHYASADLFLFPSMTETFGNVTPEAMASGLPLLAFDHAAAGQLVRSGRNGMLVPPGDARAFVSAAVDLAIDVRRRRAIGLAARESACEWGWDRVVASFEGVLAGAIQPGPCAEAPLQGPVGLAA